MSREKHALYRFFDHTGVLVYVGITNNPDRRFAKHAMDKDWWHEVADVRIEKHPSRESVLLAEKAAIQNERPIYNIVHNRPKADAMSVPFSPASKNYPVQIDDAVALCMSSGECPVGRVTGLFEFGVKVAMFNWLSSYFACEAVIRWDLIEEIHFADINPDGIPDMDHLAHRQTLWCQKRDNDKDGD